MNNYDNNSENKAEEYWEEVIKYNRDNLEKEMQELQERIKKDIEKDRKYLKKMKAFSISLIIYMATIVIVAVCMIVFPSFIRIGNVYLLLCNIMGLGLCVWNVFHLFKTGLIKEGIGKWLCILGIFGAVVNLFAIFDDYIIRRFF